MGHRLAWLVTGVAYGPTFLSASLKSHQAWSLVRGYQPRGEELERLPPVLVDRLVPERRPVYRALRENGFIEYR
jgi:hypothetical protein